MELRELRYFVQIARDHSYTKAAKRLYVSQPALSKMMRKLEDEFQVPLFEVYPSGVFLTDYGEALYAKAVPLLSEFDALQNFAADVRGVKSGKLRVGVTPMLGSLYLVDILVDFSNQYPGVELKLVENGSREIRRQLVSGDIDVGICITDPGSDYEFLENIKLFEDVMMVCVNEVNPLAQRTALRFEDLKDEDFNFYGIASFLHTQIKDRCIRAGFEPKINITSSKVDMIMQMSAKRKGICILPRPYAERRLLPGLKLIPFEEPFPWISCFVKNKKLYQSYVSRLFEQYVVNYFRQRYSASGEEDGRTAEK